MKWTHAVEKLKTKKNLTATHITGLNAKQTQICFLFCFPKPSSWLLRRIRHRRTRPKTSASTGTGTGTAPVRLPGDPARSDRHGVDDARLWWRIYLPWQPDMRVDCAGSRRLPGCLCGRDRLLRGLLRLRRREWLRWLITFNPRINKSFIHFP